MFRVLYSAENSLWLTFAADLTQRIPAEFDLEMVQRLHPQDYHESMNTVLVQELSRFNALLSVVCTRFSKSCNHAFSTVPVSKEGEHVHVFADPKVTT